MTNAEQNFFLDCQKMQAKNLRVFVISICDGIGAAFVACNLIKLAVKGLACESNKALSQFVKDAWPAISTHDKAETVDRKLIQRLFRASGSTVLLFIAGPDCQPFSGMAS